jgi:hypothetical protein
MMDCSYEAGYKNYIWYSELIGQAAPSFEEWMHLREKVDRPVKVNKTTEFLKSSGSEEPLGLDSRTQVKKSSKF